MSNLEHKTVKRVKQALVELHLPNIVQELPCSSKNVAGAAEALGVEQGAIVKTLVYSVGNRYVLVFIGGNQICQADQLSRAFGLEGSVVYPSGDLVRAVTGFSIGGVAPVGLVAKLPIVIDASLKKHEKIYVSAGDAHCVFATTADELKQLTAGLVSYAIAKA